MSIDELKIAPHDLGMDWRDWPQPLAIVDLDAAAEFPPFDLPPFPLIGVGRARGPLASLVDAVIEAPVSRERLIGSIQANPNAAAVVSSLLRAIPEVSVRVGLQMESFAMAVLQGSAEHRAWSSRRVRASETLGPGRVELGRRDDVLEVILDRAEANNAVDQAMRDRLGEAFQLAALDEDIRTVRLLGAGKAFCIGADLSEFGTTSDPATAHLIRAETLPAHRLVEIAAKLEAHIAGACVGAGLEMAAFARKITATRKAWFQLPELAMGILPGAGGCVSVSRRIGRQRTALMVLSGARISVETALAWGLIDAIVDD